MQDETNVAKNADGKLKAKGKGAKAAPAATESEMQIARTMVRVFWMETWSAANPDKSPAERAEAWKAERQAAMASDLKKMRRIAMGLGRQGVVMTLTEKHAKDDAPLGDETEFAA